MYQCQTIPGPPESLEDRSYPESTGEFRLAFRTSRQSFCRLDSIHSVFSLGVGK